MQVEHWVDIEHITDGMKQLLKCLDEQFTIIVRSGYRSPVYNERVGGSKSSQHCLGTAVDISSPNAKCFELAAYAIRLGWIKITGIGLDVFKDYVHLDTGIGPNRPAIWVYDRNGKDI